jgi:hypothetical protein
MSYETIAAIMADAERRAVASGVPAIVAATELMRAEAVFVNAIARSARAERQFVLDLNAVGTKELAQKHKKSPRTIRRWKAKAFNKIGHLHRSMCPSA